MVRLFDPSARRQARRARARQKLSVFEDCYYCDLLYHICFLSILYDLDAAKLFRGF